MIPAEFATKLWEHTFRKFAASIGALEAITFVATKESKSKNYRIGHFAHLKGKFPIGK